MSDVINANGSYIARQTENEALIKAARLMLGMREGDAVFIVLSPSGDPFEAWFDKLPFDARRTNQLVDFCAQNFAALAFFYGDARGVDRTNDLHELKSIIGRQFNSSPVELYAAWSK